MDIPKKAGYHGSMRPNGTSQQLEKRRLQAIAMLESGKSYQTVANRLSASLSSVVRWVQSYRCSGAQSRRVYLESNGSGIIQYRTPRREELQALLSNSVAKIGNSQKLLWSCIYASDLPWR
jgi:hypothetical protein